MRKIFYILLAGLAISLMTIPIHAGGYRYVFFENFNNITAPALPAGWATEDGPPLDGITWHGRDVAGFQGSACARFLTTAPGNDWIFTSPIPLTGGVQYTLIFKTRVSAGTSHIMDVMYGMAQNSAAMGPTIISLPVITNLDPQEIIATFTPAIPGIYFIGFRCISPAGMLGLFLDDVTVAIPETDLQVQLVVQKTALTGLNTFSETEEKMCHVILQNTGTPDLLVNTLFSVGDANDPNSALAFIVKDPLSATVPYMARNRVGIPADSDFTTLSTGDCANKFFDLNNGGFDFSQIGTYTIEVEYENLYPSTSGAEWKGKIVSDPVIIQIN